MNQHNYGTARELTPEQLESFANFWRGQGVREEREVRTELDEAVEELLRCSTDMRAWPDLTTRAQRVRELMREKPSCPCCGSRLEGEQALVVGFCSGKCARSKT